MGTGLYEIWKMERRAWLEGPQGIGDFVMPDAVVVSPDPMPIQTYAEVRQATERAAPFTEVIFAERHFHQRGDTVVIAYNADARHQRFRRRYKARCSSTYVKTGDGWRLIAHTHARL